ncbi:RimJ/RimL family protein N-acetyltransferase [Microbacterium resistens]|uniref:RimJ/RimL family protein N-acetyltransferase n=1 Tax=Microbacterium resistens TaxID=156977 RepID=A0ABU1SFW6_9MICO|nr:GNAT family N-acetyltransferase [Microbacterium resistens]MDR6868495.1 RimJ/RimL family protein N-acetyltransferase [Microbacterium resistens]
MSARPVNALETARLLLRRQREEEAAVYRQMWTERDPRVPPHRRIDDEGHPTVEDIAAHIRDEQGTSERGASGLGLLAVERKDTAEVIGYCGVVFAGNGSPEDPELAFELLRAVHGNGYATEAGQAVIGWARVAGYRRLWATVWDWNIASRRVLEKLGFRETGRVTGESTHGRSLLTVREL